MLPELSEIEKNWKVVSYQVAETAIKCGRNPDDIKILAVSKTQSEEIIKLAVKAGIPLLGENYSQELVRKYRALEESGIAQPKWHLIGHLQTNKVKNVVPLADAIHSVDSAYLAEEVSKHAIKHGKRIDVMLQVNTSGEESKYGCEPEELVELAENALQLNGINVIGLMTIGSFTGEEAIIRSEFKLLRSLLYQMKAHFPDSAIMELSMGMSGDYEIAIEEGATYLRIGTAIFGERVYDTNI